MRVCPACSLGNPAYITFVPEVVRDRYFARWDGPNYEHPIQEIKKLARKIMSEVGLGSRKLTVSAGGGEGVFDTHIATNGEVEMKYDPFSTQLMSTGTLVGCLRHEVCHILTIPMSDISVPETEPEMMELLAQHTSCYDEYLAHIEFIQRWVNDRGFLNYKTREFDNFTILLYTLRKMRKENSFPNPLYPFHVLSAIFQDAVYFRLTDGMLRTWYAQLNAKNVGQLFEFWFEDFEEAKKKRLNRDKTIRLVQLSITLSLSIKVDELLDQDMLVFDETTNQTYLEFLRLRTAPEQQKLIQRWILRAS